MALTKRVLEVKMLFGPSGVVQPSYGYCRTANQPSKIAGLLQAEVPPRGIQSHCDRLPGFQGDPPWIGSDMRDLHGSLLGSA